MQFSMPSKAKDAFEQAHRERGKRKAAPPTNRRSDARDYLEYRKDEQAYRAKRHQHTTDDMAFKAEIFLENATPRNTLELREKVRHAANVARQARIARARSPERVRAAMVRHMNGVCFKILRERGLR